jgi:hypothetical protein
LTITPQPIAEHRIEDTTGWPTRKFTRTVRRARTIEIQAAPHHHADTLPDDLAQAPLTALSERSSRQKLATA